MIHHIDSIYYRSLVSLVDANPLTFKIISLAYENLPAKITKDLT